MPGTVPPPPDSLLGLGQSPNPPSVVGRGSNSGAATAVTNFAPSASALSQGADLIKVCPTCGVRYPVEFKVCPRDAAELADVQTEAESDEMVGQTIASSYTIVRVLGEGGMGRVYEARHTRIGGKRFAVKMLHPEYTRQPEVLSRFQREAEAAATIDSPYVVDVYDVDRTADGRAFLVAEFLQGKEFADYLEQAGKMPVGAAVRIVRQICKALADAHAKGIVHRDMKPENVFLTGDPAAPVAKVIDFGISKLDDRPGTALTKTGMIMGTPSYMAPEQARGERVDHRADIYAVGAILYCALTGKRPFDLGDPTATLTAVLMQDPPRPRSLEPSIPEALEMIVQKAMAKLPQDRYESMAELDEELAAYEPGGESTLLNIPAAPGQSSAWMRASSSDVARSGSLTRQVRTVALARPLIIVLGVLGVLWAGGSLVMAITGVLRAIKGTGPRDNLEAGEAILLVLGVTFTLLTPIMIAVRWLARTVWGNSVKAVELADTLRRPVLVGLSAYGFASLVVRLIESVALRHAVGVAWPYWEVALFAAGAIAAGAAYLMRAAEKPKAA
jgi:serine/threonine-protein kinase